MIIGKLIGEADGHVESRQFSDVEQVKLWAMGAGLVDFSDQSACGEAWEGGTLRWRKSGLQTQDQRELDRKRYATHMGLSSVIKKGLI